MKRVFLVVFVVLILAGISGQAFADIGENFAPAGIEVYGDLYLSFEAGWIFWEFNEAQYLELGLRPGIATYISPNLSFYVSPQFNYEKDLPSGSSRWEVILYSGIAYYFVSNPGAATGLVPSIGAGIAIEYDNYWDEIYLGLAPRVRLLYFLTDRIAPYILLEPYFSAPMSDFMTENIYLTIRAYVGMSFYFPSRDYVLGAK